MKHVLLAVGLLVPSLALAGGFEFPGNDAEALGRGAAFTAKADDAAAFEYNVAGFARQRGTRLLFSGNLVLHDYEFQRAGTYPDNPSDPMTPWGGMPFPKVSNQGGPFFAPMLGVSTDFGIFDRWTFAVGVYGPSAYGKRQFPLTVNGAPSPSRYDLISEDLLIVYPSIAAAVRIAKWFELGMALHVVVGHFQLASAGLVDLGRATCLTAEYTRCDSVTSLNLTGVSATASLGMMFRPLPGLSIGTNVRGPVALDAHGTANGTAPDVQATIPIEPAEASFHTELPWVVRLGVRYAFLKDGFEHGDVEIDGGYESWSQAQGLGSAIKIPNLSIFSDINPVVVHRYMDTYSVRVGGAYNIKLPAGVLSLRLGFFFDSAATEHKDTRLDFDTMAKYAPTAGIGYKVRGIAINLAYAYVWSPDRDVTNGDIRIINAVTNGSFVSSQPDRALLPAVNNGHYHALTQVFGVSVNVAFDEALKKQRTLRYN